MRKLIKNIFWAVLLVAMTAQFAQAFSLIGPGATGGSGGDAWEQPIIGYGLPGDVGTPKNIAEEYRRVTPVMYYASDATFISFFGTAGLTNIDSAFAIMNGVLCGQTNASLFLTSPTNGIVAGSISDPYTGIPIVISSSNNLDAYTRDLTDFPLESQQLNYTAQALGLFDMRSATLELLVEQMGLAEPERYAWTLHDRYLPPGGKCPLDELYLVVQRNFDIIDTPLNQTQYSPYINGTLYTYDIIEFCTGPNPLAFTLPVAVDIFADTYTAVASFRLYFGGFYTSLTRDDVAGLRYLMTSNNINFEATAPSGAQLLQTNILAPQLFTTAPIGLLFSQSVTNDPNTLLGLYPGLTYLSVGTNYLNQITTNIGAYFTNLAGPFTNHVDFSNNVAVYPTNGTIPFTNWSPVQYGGIQLLPTLSLATFLAQARVSDPVTLQALYPGLLFGNVFTNFHLLQVTTNISSFFTNLAGPYTNHVPLSNGVAVYPANGTVPFTNWSPIQYGDPPQLLRTLPLTPLLFFAQFIDPVTLEGLYPGLLVDHVVTNYLAVQITTNVFPYFTNQSVLPVFSNSANGIRLPNITTLTNLYYFTNQPGPTIINYDTSSYLSITTLDLATFSGQSYTNDPATMQALYPGLQIVNFSKFPTTLYVTNFVTYLTNYNGAPYSTPPITVTKAISTNSYFGDIYAYTFGNVFTNHYYTNRIVRTRSIWLTNFIGAPFGSRSFTFTNDAFITNRMVSGDFFIYPTNWCGFDLLLSTKPNVNPPYSYGPTNTVIFQGYTSTSGLTYGLTNFVSDIFTNYLIAVRPGICEPVLVFGTNYTTNAIYKYEYNFLNVVTNHYYSNSMVSLFITNIYYVPGGSPDLLATNIYQTNFFTNLPSGDFYIVPTNWCGYQIVSLLTNLIAPTNIVLTNQGFGSGTITSAQYTVVEYLTYTNYTYSIRPGFCEPVVGFATNYTTNIVVNYQYDYVNLVTNTFYTNSPLVTVVTNDAVWTNGLVGWVTNILQVYSNSVYQPDGTFYIVPTTWCGFQLLGLQTNILTSTNQVVATNLLGVAILPGQQYSVTTYAPSTNYIFSIRPGVCEPALAITTNFSTNSVTQYNYYFGNSVITNNYVTNSPIITVTTNKAVWTNGLVGMITNIIYTTTNYGISGDFYIIPQGDCDFRRITNMLSAVVYTTNTFTATNLSGVDIGQQYVQTTVSAYTNTTFLVQASTCATVPAAAALRQGIGRVEFIRANYDSLLGQFFQPLTNYYTMVRVTNSQPVTEFYQRVITQPDFLIRARDLANGPSGIPAVGGVARNLNFDQSQILAGLAGPGTIIPTTSFTYNKVGNIYANGSQNFFFITTNGFLNEYTGGSFFGTSNRLSVIAWGSFDGSTNDPVVYPNGTSIANVVNQLFISVTPTTVPDATNGVAYPAVSFAGSGGQLPYTWSAPNLSGLVPGMTFNAGTATLSGTPTATGTFSFTLQLTDAVNRTVSLNYSILIH